jgi:glycosyltransferase involved in cell wall biosynthesis
MEDFAYGQLSGALMKILMVHNAYQQRGGEDAVFAAEAQMLAAHGHTIVKYERHNDELRDRGRLAGISMGIKTIWAFDSYRTLSETLDRERPDIAQFYNTFPLVSPAAYHACEKAGVPVVQSLQNYRLICPSATLLRDGGICESCVTRRVAWPGVVHGCYRGSRAATAAVAAMLAVHRAMGTWREKVSAYVATTQFAKEKFCGGGLPADRVFVKPNSVYPGPGVKVGAGQYALYVGRLAAEKGIEVLLAAWGRLGGQIPLRLAGHGPLSEYLASRIDRAELQGAEFVGSVPTPEVFRLLLNARFLVFPSIWFEGFPITIVEALASGVPVVASRLGAMEEIIEDHRTGLHFKSGDPEDLAAKVEWAWTHPKEMEEMGRAARREYEAKYTPERNYEDMMKIYDAARANGAS